MDKFCEYCPNKANGGCPAWIEPAAGFTERNLSTGEERFVTGCFYQVVPRLMAHVVAAANAPAAAIESTRNDIVRGFRGVSTILDAALHIGPTNKTELIGNG